MNQLSGSDGLISHARSAEQCLQALGSSLEGLGSSKASRRLAVQGPNRLEVSGGRSRCQILIDQFSNAMLILLLAVAVVSAAIDLALAAFPKDAIAILVIVLLNAMLGYLQESRAEQALQALRGMAQPQVQVRRDGRWQQLASEQLVPGDLIRLEAGDRVAADARLLEAVELALREAALTGEAEAVFKRADLQLEEATPLLERRNVVFQGTDVVRGRGLALVSATGMQTELGQIAKLIRSAGGERTPLQQRLDGLAKVLVGGALSLVALVVLLGSVLGQPLLNLLEVALSMAVAIVPEGLPAVITVTLAIGTQRMVQRSALIRRLPAVEGLGSVTVICSDKTGTLTQNRQVVEALRLAGSAGRVSGSGYSPDGRFHWQGPAPPAAALELLLCAGVLCSDAQLQQRGGSWEVLGDPTEGALLVVAAKGGIEAEALRQRHPRQREIPFSSDQQRMAVWVADSDGQLQSLLDAEATSPGQHRAAQLLISKGAPEVILPLCHRSLQASGLEPLDPAAQQQWLNQAQELAAAGLRVLAFAAAPAAAGGAQQLSD